MNEEKFELHKDFMYEPDEGFKYANELLDIGNKKFEKELEQAKLFLMSNGFIVSEMKEIEPNKDEEKIYKKTCCEHCGSPIFKEVDFEFKLVDKNV